MIKQIFGESSFQNAYNLNVFFFNTDYEEQKVNVTVLQGTNPKIKMSAGYGQGVHKVAVSLGRTRLSSSRVEQVFRKTVLGESYGVAVAGLLKQMFFLNRRKIK